MATSCPPNADLVENHAISKDLCLLKFRVVDLADHFDRTVPKARPSSPGCPDTSSIRELYAAWDDEFQIPQTLSGEFTPLPRANAHRTEAARLMAALSDLISARKLAAWLQVAKPGLDGRMPRRLFEAGKLDLLWEMVHQTRYGAFA